MMDDPTPKIPRPFPFRKRILFRIDAVPLAGVVAAARTDHDKTVLQRQIDATDRDIDRLVYDLYGLTDEEIAMVEECGNK